MNINTQKEVAIHVIGTESELNSNEVKGVTDNSVNIHSTNNIANEKNARKKSSILSSFFCCMKY